MQSRRAGGAACVSGARFIIFEGPLHVPAFQLVLQFRGTTIEDLDELLEVEDALTQMLESGEELAGHGIGSDARNIFIVTDEPDATFRRLRPFLERAHLLDQSIIAARPVNDAQYRIMWPPDLRQEFSVT